MLNLKIWLTCWTTVFQYLKIIIQKNVKHALYVSRNTIELTQILWTMSLFRQDLHYQMNMNRMRMELISSLPRRWWEHTHMTNKKELFHAWLYQKACKSHSMNKAFDKWKSNSCIIFQIISLAMGICNCDNHIMNT